MQPCGDCTLCCKLLEIHEIPSDIDVYCQHCDECVGCAIHKTRPKECRDYQCMWSQMDTVGIEMRPDKCGIIFDRMSDDVISARLESNKKMNPFVVGQINAFMKEGFSLIVFRGRQKKFYLQDHHTEQYVIEAIS